MKVLLLLLSSEPRLSTGNGAVQCDTYLFRAVCALFWAISALSIYVSAYFASPTKPLPHGCMGSIDFYIS